MRNQLYLVWLKMKLKHRHMFHKLKSVVVFLKIVNKKKSSLFPVVFNERNMTAGSCIGRETTWHCFYPISPFWGEIVSNLIPGIHIVVFGYVNNNNNNKFISN